MRLVAGIRQHADYLEAHLTPERNHRTLELYALFIVALALPSTAGEEARLQFAWRALQENMEADFRADGVHREHSTHYHMIVLRSFVAARENALLAGFAIPRGYDDRLRRALAFGLACHRPDGTMPALSDGDIGRYADLLVQSAAVLNHPGSATISSFHHAGYYIQRGAPDHAADGGSAERHLIFDCGQLGDGGHGHYDVLSIDVWCGRHLIVDPGRYTYDGFDRVAAVVQGNRGSQHGLRRRPRSGGLSPGQAEAASAGAPAQSRVDAAPRHRRRRSEEPAVRRRSPAPCALRRRRVLACHRRARSPDPARLRPPVPPRRRCAGRDLGQRRSGVRTLVCGCCSMAREQS